MTIWESLMKCQTIITFQDKYSNDELPWNYALTSISSRQWGVDISILCVEQGMERGRREHGREGGKVGVWKNYLVDEAIIKDWTADLLEHLIQCLDLTHTDCPINQPPKLSKPLSRNPLPASHIGTHTHKMAGQKAVYSWHTYRPQYAVYATNFETSCCCASHHDAQWRIHDAPWCTHL